MGFGETIVLIVAIVVIGRVMSGGRWNRETRRWERSSPDNPYVRSAANDEVPLLRKEIAKLKEKQQELEAKLDRTSDSAQQTKLQKEIDAVEQELSQKDTESYRRENATFWESEI